MENTTVDLGCVELRGGKFQDDELNFGGAGTVVAGTILARNSSTGKLIPFVKDGNTDGNGIPKAVMTYDVTATGSGEVPVRPLIAGEVKANRLVIHADGDNSNVDAEVLDALRAYGIVATDVTQLGLVDNPQPQPEDS